MMINFSKKVQIFTGQDCVEKFILSLIFTEQTIYLENNKRKF